MKTEICQIQQTLTKNDPDIFLGHDYYTLQDTDGTKILRCRRCGFISHCWRMFR
jgi:hypothetical protein